jgi:O-antigen/teichoic acid export membrane protein
MLPEYDTVWVLVAILTPGVIVQGASRILFGELSSMDVPRAMTTIGVSSALASLAYIPLCSAYGTIGAAVGSTTLYIAQSLLVAAIFRHEVRRVGR